MDVRVTGADQAAAIGKALLAAGDAGKGHRREVLRGVQRAAKPLKEDAREGARQELPRRGGLNEVVAGSLFSVRTSLAASRPGVKITVKGRQGQVHDVVATNAGRLRHPVHADPNKTRKEWTWVTQDIRPGWFTNAMEAGAPTVQKELLKSMEAVLQTIIKQGSGHR